MSTRAALAWCWKEMEGMQRDGLSHHRWQLSRRTRARALEGSVAGAGRCCLGVCSSACRCCGLRFFGGGSVVGGMPTATSRLLKVESGGEGPMPEPKPGPVLRTFFQWGTAAGRWACTHSRHAAPPSSTLFPVLSASQGNFCDRASQDDILIVGPFNHLDLISPHTPRGIK